MTIANPLAWALLLLAIPIILFFLLKVRLRKEGVTTMIFWRQVIEERRNRRLRRWFRYFFSLLLALLFLSFLTVAVMDPALFTARTNQHVIIIDNSASMNALLSESGLSRLDLAKHHAIQRLHRLSGSPTALLTASIEPQIISGFTSHSGTLRQKAAEISGTDFPADINATLRLAEQLVAGNPEASIYVYTDNKESALNNPPTATEVIYVGESIDNLAVTRFQPRRLPNHLTDYEIFLEVINFGTATAETTLEIECEGRLTEVLPLVLEPHVPVTRIIRNTSAGGGLFRATLTSTDLFPTDNTAVAFLSEQYVQQILLYGQENFFLWHILQSLPLTEVMVIEQIPEVIPPDSVLVLHQRVPATLPLGNLLIIDPLTDCDLFAIGERIEQPLAANVDAESPLVRFISPGLNFAHARILIPQKSNITPLIKTADDFPLYLQFIADNQRVLALSADLNQGDFSLRTAFPILISQALTFLRNTAEMQRVYSTAEPVRLTLQTEHSQVILRSPSGRERIFPCQNGVVSLGRLGECGVWTILEPAFESASGRELARIAANLFHASASDLPSATEVPIRAEDEYRALFDRTLFFRPIWFYLALLALILTATEWWLYQRRWIE